MPTYVYKCPICSKQKEMNHRISEVDEPSEELIEDSSCGINTCDQVNQLDFVNSEGTRWERVPQLFNGMLFGGSLNKEKKIKSLRARAEANYEKEIKPIKYEMNKKLLG